MNNDLITILGNFSTSLYPVQNLITGGAYLLGLVFIISALAQFKKDIGHSKGHTTFSPVMYLLCGALLFYTPSALWMFANTAFGVGNVLTYANYSNYNIFNIMGMIIRTAGLIWFVRGCVLIAHASQPGQQHGYKGMAFIIAGILAINFDNTVQMLNGLMGMISRFT